MNQIPYALPPPVFMDMTSTSWKQTEEIIANGNNTFFVEKFHFAKVFHPSKQPENKNPDVIFGKYRTDAFSLLINADE